MIILTTHYMDEAEYLADRVAVVSKGALKVCGTTSFLKQKFGQYFYLEVESTQEPAVSNQDLINHLESFNQSYKNGRDSIASNQLMIIEEFKQSTDSKVSTQAFVHMYEPVSFQTDEAGKIVYKLCNYMATHFAEIFA